MALKSAEERWSKGVWTDGYRSTPSSRRVAGHDREACNTLGWARGRWRMVIDGELCEEDDGGE
jgi:hypothetical protein